MLKAVRLIIRFPVYAYVDTWNTLIIIFFYKLYIHKVKVRYTVHLIVFFKLNMRANSFTKGVRIENILSGDTPKRTDSHSRAV